MPRNAGTINGRTINAVQGRRPESDFCYLLRGNITPESQHRNPEALLPIYHSNLLTVRKL